MTIKELHDNTGALIRRAGASSVPVSVTDRGSEVAVVTRRSMVRMPARKRILLPEYEALMRGPPGNDLQGALDAVRGDR